MNIIALQKFGIEGPSEGKLVIDLHNRWCMPCRTISPVLEGFRDEGLIDLIQVDLDENRELGQALNVTSVPTLLFFKDGELLSKDITIDGYPVVKGGVMVGAMGDIVLREAIEQM